MILTFERGARKDMAAFEESLYLYEDDSRLCVLDFLARPSLKIPRNIHSQILPPCWFFL